MNVKQQNPPQAFYLIEGNARTSTVVKGVARFSGRL